MRVMQCKLYIARTLSPRQIDMMSDVENVDILLGSYSRDDGGKDHSENELNPDSGSSSRENSEITIETTRMINEEISNQMSRKLDEIKNGLNIQIQNAISSAITEKILSSIQKQKRVNYTLVDRGSIGLQDRAKSTNFNTGDRRSGELQWNSEVENARKSWENRPRKCFMQENSRLTSRQSSVDSDNSERNRDSNLMFDITSKKTDDERSTRKLE